MEHDDFNTLLRQLIHMSSEIAKGNYSQTEGLFALTQTGQYPQLVVELAEVLGVMAVKVEAREYHLE
jgi:hypothetical protein